MLESTYKEAPGTRNNTIYFQRKRGTGKLPLLVPHMVPHMVPHIQNGTDTNPLETWL